MNFLSRCDNLSHVILKSVSRLQQVSAVLRLNRPAPSLLRWEQGGLTTNLGLNPPCSEFAPPGAG